MEMKKIRRVVGWVAINGVMAWCAWVAVHGNEGAGRVLAFASWLCAVVYWVHALAPDNPGKQKVQERGRAVPGWVSRSYDTALMLFLVWHGWWWTAIAVTLQMIGEDGMYAKKQKADAPRAHRADVAGLN